MLSGGSTGGWIAAAHQVFYPDFYGGSFASCPDSVDFSYHQIVDIYKDANAYFFDKGWMKVERPNERRPDGNIVSMMKDENWYELVVGDKSRSGGQWDIWEATYSPVGPDGYPKRLWNKATGEIDKSVAEQWKKYDLLHILRDQLGDARTEGRAQAQRVRRRHGLVLPEQRGRAAQRVPREGGQPEVHRRGGASSAVRRTAGDRGAAELLQKMTAQIERVAPVGADLKEWRYR